MSTNKSIFTIRYTSIIENIHGKLDQREQAIGIFLGLNKAFGTVDHNILVEKLEH